MILITDSGSSKCDWVFCETSKNEVKRVRSKGLNPNILTKKQLKSIIENNNDLSAFFNCVKKIYFFGAGCGTITNQEKIKKILKLYFQNAEIVVEQDTMAAVWALAHQKAVVCILGTGSNTCYYDGTTAYNKIPPLGYVVMDEGSGNHLGKELLKSYYYKQMPLELRLAFEDRYNLCPQKIVKKIYSSKTPNKYLANFARFVFENLEHHFIVQLLKKVINSFIENHLILYEDELKAAPLHFVGSIAYHSRDFIIEALQNKEYEVSSFMRRPVENLIENILDKSEQF